MTSQTLQTLASQQASQRNSEVIDLLLWMLEHDLEPQALTFRKAAFASHPLNCPCGYHTALSYYTHYKIRLHRLAKRACEVVRNSPEFNNVCQQIDFAVIEARRWKKIKDEYLVDEDRTAWTEFYEPTIIYEDSSAHG